MELTIGTRVYVADCCGGYEATVHKIDERITVIPYYPPEKQVRPSMIGAMLADAHNIYESRKAWEQANTLRPVRRGSSGVKQFAELIKSPADLDNFARKYDLKTNPEACLAYESRLDMFVSQLLGATLTQSLSINSAVYFVRDGEVCQGELRTLCPHVNELMAEVNTTDGRMLFLPANHLFQTARDANVYYKHGLILTHANMVKRGCITQKEFIHQWELDTYPARKMITRLVKILYDIDLGLYS